MIYRKKKQINVLSDVCNEMHLIVSKKECSEEDLMLLRNLTNYLTRTLSCPYRAIYHEMYVIAQMAPWIFEKIYTYESDKRAPYPWERLNWKHDFPTKEKIVVHASKVFSYLERYKIEREGK